MAAKNFESEAGGPLAGCLSHRCAGRGSRCTNSSRAIAGICNEQRNVMGMMPHPERASDALLGGVDGRVILESMIYSLAHA